MNIASGEKVLIEVRRHWYLLLIEFLPLILLALTPIIGLVFLENSNLSVEYPRLSEFAIILSLIWALVVWIILFLIWTNYYLDVWIVTDRRVIDIEQHSLFSREVSECRLENIEDITVEVDGLLATWLDFGTIYLQTASTESQFIIRYIPKPTEVKEIIRGAHDQAVNKFARFQ